MRLNLKMPTESVESTNFIYGRRLKQVVQVGVVFYVISCTSRAQSTGIFWCLFVLVWFLIKIKNLLDPLQFYINPQIYQHQATFHIRSYKRSYVKDQSSTSLQNMLILEIMVVYEKRRELPNVNDVTQYVLLLDIGG